MAELNFDLFEYYHSRAVQGDGEAARDLLRLLADRVSDPKQEPLQQQERDVLAMILRRFSEYSDDVEKEREDKQRRKWTPMRVFMPEGREKLPDAGKGPPRMARKAADYDRRIGYIDAIVAHYRAAGLAFPDKLPEGPARKVEASLAASAKRTGRKGPSYKTLQRAYNEFRPYLDAHLGSDNNPA